MITIFDNPLCVGMALFVFLVAILSSYILWLAHNAPVEETNWEEIVTETPGSFMQIDINTAGLFKKYRADQIAEAKVLADQYLDSKKSTALIARRTAYTQAANLSCRMLAKATGSGLQPETTIPSILSSLAKNETVRMNMDGGKRQVKVSCSRIFSSIAVSDAAPTVENTHPAELLSWFGKFETEGCQYCAQFMQDLASVTTILNTLKDSEENTLNNARAYMEVLDHGLSFDFLASEDNEWIIHLTVFSWIGLIIAAYAQLVVNMNERNPTGLTFIFTLFRFITAPVIAFVFVATISYGLVDEPIALNHTPMFVIFAFATGYMSESFNLMLRAGLNNLIPSFGINAEKIKGATDLKAAAKKILSRPKQRPQSGTTLPELEKALQITVDDGLATMEANAAVKLNY
jgi:hypothetical protein